MRLLELNDGLSNDSALISLLICLLLRLDDSCPLGTNTPRQLKLRAMLVWGEVLLEGGQLGFVTHMILNDRLFHRIKRRIVQWGRIVQSLEIKFAAISATQQWLRKQVLWSFSGANRVQVQPCRLSTTQARKRCGCQIPPFVQIACWGTRIQHLPCCTPGVPWCTPGVHIWSGWSPLKVFDFTVKLYFL